MPTTTKKKTTEPAAEGEVKKAPRKTAAKPRVKAEVSAADAPEMEAAELAKGGTFVSTVGRRKTAIARVRLIKNGKGMITINGKKMEKYFSNYDEREQVQAPLKVTGQETAVDVSATVVGGGIRGQAEAVRHGISRALVIVNPTYRTSLKKLGYMTRDPRKRERKKFGKKGARRSPQWSKR